MSDWQTTRERFIKIVFRRSVEEVAREIPAHKVTVYRLINNPAQRPHHATRHGIERIVREADID